MDFDKTIDKFKQYMTPEQRLIKSLSAQKESWLLDTKLKCRLEALRVVSSSSFSSTGDMVADANKIYQWLMEGFE